MKIEVPCVVALTWSLTDALNAPIDELTDAIEFFVGGDDLLPKVEEALIGQTAGQEAHLHLEPEHAFGEYDADLVCFEDRALVPEGQEVGMQFEGLPAGAKTPDMPPDLFYRVTEIYPSHVVLDGNHPLAGMALRLALKVRAVRAATADEVEARSVGNEELSLLSLTPPAGDDTVH